MSTQKLEPDATLALNTKLEDDFVSPLTAIRGALEIMRDFPELTDEQRQRFVNTALRACGRLEVAVDDLAASVYRAALGTSMPRAALGASPRTAAGPGEDGELCWSQRFVLHPEQALVDVDMSGLEFTSSATVNGFYDALERVLGGPEKRWYFLVNYTDFKVWPEAWVAFAHRAKKINLNLSHGSARYIERAGSPVAPGAPHAEADAHPSRAAALAHLQALRDSSV